MLFPKFTEDILHDILRVFFTDNIFLCETFHPGVGGYVHFFELILVL